MDILEKVFKSPSRLGIFLVLLTFALSIPFTYSLLARQEAENTFINSRITEGMIVDMSGGFGQNDQGQQRSYTCTSGRCDFNGDQNNTVPGYGSGQINYGTLPPVNNSYQNNQNNQYQNNGQPNPRANNNGNSNVGGQSGQAGAQTAGQNLDNCNVSGQDSGLNTLEANFLNLLNQYRQSRGLSTVTSSSKLSGIAAWLSNDMANKNYFNHTDSLGRNEMARMSSCGISNYNTADGGEIITAGTNHDAQAALDWYKNSPPHNAVMINPRNIQVGIGFAENPNSTYKKFWTVVFGSSSDGTSATILPPEPTPTTAPQPTPTAVPFATPIPGATTPVPGATAAPLPSPTPIPDTTSIALVITSPGIGSNIEQGENALPVGKKNGEIMLIDKDNKETTIKTVFEFKLNDSNFTAAVPLKPGNYGLKIRADNSLWNDTGLIEVVQNQTTKVPAVALIVGDINGDNALDLTDYNAIISCFGANSCGQNTNRDLNMDGKADEKDLNIFYTSLSNRQGD